MAYVPPTREERRRSLMEYSARWPNERRRSMQHMLDLDDEFPEVDIFGPQCISAEVGPGWAGILRPVLEALRDNGCKAGQIKQKFGGLRVYWDFPDEIESALDEWRMTANRQVLDGKLTVDPPAPFQEETRRLRELIGPVIEEAERLSFMTCETCGARTEPQGPSYGTYCQACK